MKVLDGTTPGLITQWNKAGTIWCHHLSITEVAVNRICFLSASCERFPIRNRIIPVPGQWCRFQIIPESCERGISGLRIYTGDYKAQGPTLFPTEGRALRGPRALDSPV